MINVTKSYLPNIEKYKSYIDEIYKTAWLTNQGPLVQKLEKRLAQYLGVKNIVLVSNGTIALEIAYRALDLKGEVITTPFSFVATTSSLVTNRLTPIFVDIDEKTFNLNPKNIEKKITSRTSAILPVHVFGNACEVEEIKKIANKHNLKVIYDAAHAFDVKYKDKSLLSYGDISTLSFHATKLFHTIEGGALIINDDSLLEKVRYLINFGIKNQEEIPHLGTNAKMNEFEAAMGLCILDDIENIKNSRKNDSKLNSNVVNNKPKTLTTPSQNVKKKKVEVAKSTGGTNEKNVSTQKDLLKTISSSNTNTKEVLQKSGNGTNKQLASNISAPTVSSSTGGRVILDPYKAPTYPDSAKSNGITGKVFVKFKVENGVSSIISTSGPSELASAVKKVSPSWRIKILDSDGKSTSGIVTVTINFIM
mgnify:CR=1 FL=1